MKVAALTVALAVLPCTVGAAPPSASYVPGNASLNALPTFQSPDGVWRYGFAGAGDAGPPVSYSASGAACSLGGGSGDGGSQIRSGDGKCWVAKFPPLIDWRLFGAKEDGTTDDSAAINAAASATPVILMRGGAVTSGSTYLWNVLAQDDGLTNSNANAFSGVLSVFHTISGAAASKSNVSTLGLNLNVATTTGCGAASACNNYQTLLGSAAISAAQGGTGTAVATGKGSIFGAGFVAYAHSGATNLLDVNAQENNWAVEAGASAALASGIALVPQPTHAVPGAVVDAFIDISNQSTTGVHNVIFLNNAHGQAPLDATNGCVICTDGGAHTIKTGIDFGNYTITGNALSNGTNFQITGGGLFYGSGNAPSGIPSPQVTSWLIDDNLSGSGGEVNLWNRQSNGRGFEWEQVTGSGTYSTLGMLNLTGFSVTGSGVAYPTNTTQPFVYLTIIGGAPTATPVGATAGKAACTYDTTNHKLWCFDPVTVTWKGVVLS